MATLRAFQGLDMLDFDQPVDSMQQINTNLAFMETRDGHWYVYGAFEEAGDALEGRIKRTEVFDLSGDIVYEARGLDLNASFMSVGLTTAFATRAAFKHDDLAVGSSASDRLAGFSGDDVLRGNGGRDSTFGNDGDDRLYGGRGRDHLSGGAGNDNLVGGQGGDVLRGGPGADVFLFTAGSGRDVIVDFTDGRDGIEIRSGAERFRDIVVTQTGDDVFLAFGNAEITLRDVSRHDLGASDFLFV